MNHDHDQRIPEQPSSPSPEEPATGEIRPINPLWEANTEPSTEGGRRQTDYTDRQTGPYTQQPLLRPNLYPGQPASSGPPIVEPKPSQWNPLTTASLEELVNLITNPQNRGWEWRAAALRALPRFGYQVPKQALLKGLYDSEARVRIAALEAIAVLAYRKPVPTSIIAASLYDDEPSIQAMAIWTLSHFPGSLSVPALITLASTQDVAMEVRIAALSALHKTQMPEAITYLHNALRETQEQEDWPIRETLIQLLASDTEQLPTTMLFTITQEQTQHEMVRIAAIEALRTRTSEYHTLLYTLQRISATAVNSDDAVATAARNALESILDYYVQVVAEPAASPAERKQAVIALDNFKRLPSLPEQLLLNLLTNNDEEISRVAAYALNTKALVVLKRHPAATTNIPHIRQVFLGNRTKNTGDVTFLPVEPTQLSNRVFLLAQVLDFYYTATQILATLLRKKVGYKDLNHYIENMIRAEYIRSLISTRITVIPAESLYNIPALARDFLQEGTARDAFKELLNGRALIVYLHSQQVPHVPPLDQGWQQQGTLAAFQAWQLVCKEVTIACLRFSWRDDNDQQQKMQRFHSYLYRLLESARVTQFAEYVTSLASPEVAQSASPGSGENPLRALIQFIQEAQHGTHLRWPTRERLYQQAVLANRRTTPEKAQLIQENITLQPDGLAMKTLIDLAYHLSLADMLQGNLCTPAALPTRALMADPLAGQEESYAKIFIALQSLANRQEFFKAFPAGLYIRSLGHLSLSDVLVIRASEQWQTYAKTLDTLLNQPFTIFLQHVRSLYEQYVALMQYVTNYLEGQLDTHAKNEAKAYWNPLPAFEIEFGGARASIYWGETGPTCVTSGNSQPSIDATSGKASYSVRFHIGKRTEATVEGADIALSIEVEHGWQSHPVTQWQAFIAQITAILGEGRVRYEEVYYQGAVINLRGDA